VGVSGSQSKQRTTTSFGHGESHSIEVVDSWPCQVAVTPILDRVRRPGVVFATGTPEGVSGVGGTVGVLRAVGTWPHSAGMWRSPTGLSDTASFSGRTGRLRRTVRNPLRSDRILLIERVVCQLNAGILKLRLVSEVDSHPSDGAYPRRKRRGIAPVPRIIKSKHSRYLESYY